MLDAYHMTQMHKMVIPIIMECSYRGRGDAVMVHTYKLQCVVVWLLFHIQIVNVTHVHICAHDQNITDSYIQHNMLLDNNAIIAIKPVTPNLYCTYLRTSHLNS